MPEFLDFSNVPFMDKVINFIGEYTTKLTSLDMGSTMGVLAVFLGIAAIWLALTQIGKGGTQ